MAAPQSSKSCNKTWCYIGIAVGAAALGAAYYLMVAKKKAGPPTGAEGHRVITLAELAKHNTAQDCWIAVNGEVFNVTSFLEQHPGGPVILEHAGKDATIAFHTMGDPTATQVPERSHHSEEAQAILMSFHIGSLAK